MARVTVEDCLENVENRFKLVLLASKRARQLVLGTEPLVEWENDKPTVVALREIAENLVNDEMMQAALAVPQIEEESEFAEDDLAAALHAEISRELNQTVEPPGAEPKATEETIKALQEPTALSPMSSNPMFSSTISSEPSPSATPSDLPSAPTIETQSDPVVEPEQTPSKDDASPFSPPKPPDEGDQGF